MPAIPDIRWPSTLSYGLASVFAEEYNATLGDEVPLPSARVARWSDAQEMAQEWHENTVKCAKTATPAGTINRRKSLRSKGRGVAQPG